MVVAGEAVRAAIKDSIAAIGGVRSGSDESSDLYFFTISNWEADERVGRIVPLVILVMAGWWPGNGGGVEDCSRYGVRGGLDGGPIEARLRLNQSTLLFHCYRRLLTVENLEERKPAERNSTRCVSSGWLCAEEEDQAITKILTGSPKQYVSQWHYCMLSR